MQDIFIEFLPPWVETNLQPAFYDAESGTVLQQTARMYAKINELIKSVNNMDKVIKEYVDYIDNYFANLDVQEEINTKLDEMADSGELATIISQFLSLGPVFGYDTISAMADATNLDNGSIARVLGASAVDDGDGAFYKVRTKESGESADGYYKVAIGDELIADRIVEESNALLAFDTVADMADDILLEAGDVVKTNSFHSLANGGGATYLIRNPEESETANGYNTIALDNGLIAELLPSEVINVDQYGAYGDGIHDDYDAIQFAISNNLHKTICFSDKTYALGNTLKTWINTPKKTCFNLYPTTKLIALSSLDALIEFGGLGGTIQTTSDRRKVWKGGILDATNCDSAIKIAQTEGNVEIRECEIININHYGIYAPSPSSVDSCGLIMDGVIMYGIGGDFTTYGVYMERPDNEFMNSSIRGCRYALYFGGEHNTGGQNIINVNGLGFGSGQNEWIEDSVYCRMVGKMNFIQGCYCDTFKTFVDVRGQVTVTNCMYYSYKNNYDVKMFNMAYTTSKLILKNNNLQFPSSPATSHKGIYFPSESWSAQGTMKNVVLEGNIIDATDNTINPGDLIYTADASYMPFWNYNSQFSDQKWVKIGNIVATNVPYSLDIVSVGKHFKADFAVTRTNNTTSVTSLYTEKSDDNLTIQLGFVYNNSDSGYPTYSVYIRQTAGSALWVNPIINNFSTAKFTIMTQKTLDVTKETLTISDTITI